MLHGCLEPCERGGYKRFVLIAAFRQDQGTEPVCFTKI
jgi:hypothetical protein